MRSGACFEDVVHGLIHHHAVDPAEAVRIGERVFRGSDGTHPGLGRERVYLEAFLRVGAHLAAHRADERVLAAGQIAIDAVAAVRACLPAGQFGAG
jgi:hypothetical protein